MQLTRAGGYALQGMIYLASLPQGGEAYVGGIARDLDIPGSFLAKIFQNLSRGGLVNSRRGSGGGYMLSRPPEEITALEIIEVVEGPLCLNHCLEDEAVCPRQDECAICLMMTEAQEKLKQVFMGWTLQELSDIDLCRWKIKERRFGQGI